MFDSTFYRIIPNANMDETELRAWLRDQGWTYAGDEPPGGEIEGSRILTWIDADAENLLYLVLSEYIDIPVVMLTGERAADLAKAYASEGDVFYDRDSMVSAVFNAKDPEAQILAIHRLVASAPPEFDETYFEAFRALFELPDPQVRAATVPDLFAFPDWPELRPFLERVHEQETDPYVRRTIRHFLTDADG